MAVSRRLPITCIRLIVAFFMGQPLVSGAARLFASRILQGAVVKGVVPDEAKATGKTPIVVIRPIFAATAVVGLVEDATSTAIAPCAALEKAVAASF